MDHKTKMYQAEEIMKMCLHIMDAKGRDYSGTVNAMHNFEDFGAMGIVVRLGDKYHRLKTIIKADSTAVDESIEDTLRDMINYAILALIQRGIERGTNGVFKTS